MRQYQQWSIDGSPTAPTSQAALSDDGEEKMTPTSTGPSKGLQLRLLLPIAVIIGILAGGTVALLGGSSRPALPGGAQQAPPGGGYLGTLALPAKQAPALDLRNYLGRPVTLAEYRGRVVLVTFLYTHCPDVCPLITSKLRVVLKLLRSRVSQTQVIAISVDPRGDTPGAVASFLQSHDMLGRMQYLIGSPAQLARTWAAWSVGSTRDVGQPDRVAHSALVYGISASGRLLTIYPSSFEPSEIVHDVPKLAAG
jgi:protein SCO1/2